MLPRCSFARALQEGHKEGRVSWETVESTLSHVLEQRCLDCRETVHAISDSFASLCLGGAAAPPEDSEFQSRARDVVGKLLKRTGRQLFRYLAHSRLAYSREVIDLLNEECKRHLSSNSARAVAIGRLAVHCADYLPTERYDRASRADLCSRVLATLATAHRRDANLPAAVATITAAEKELHSGTDDPAVVAWVFQIRGQIDHDRGNFGRALSSLSRAVARLEEAALDHEMGICLFERSQIQHSLGRATACLDDLHWAARKLDYEREPRMYLILLITLALRYEVVGRYSKALECLTRAERDWKHLMNPGDEIRWHWARGRVQAALGRPNRAAADFRKGRDEFLRLGYPLDGALIALELAQVLGKLGRWEEVQKLAAELLETFRAIDVPQKAVAALQLLRTAKSLRTVESVVQSINRLKQATSSPEPSASE